jgi:prefoldin subunit 5
MPKNWEEMTTNEKLNQLRSEVDSLGRVTEGVRRRIEQIRSELKTIENMLNTRREGGA